MISSEVQRTLVKSPPELWAELSDPASLARHLGELGEIRITRAEPEKLVEWEAEAASGKVAIKASGWGTKVTLTANREPAAPPEQAEPTGEPADAGASEETPGESAVTATAAERFAHEHSASLLGTDLQRASEAEDLEPAAEAEAAVPEPAAVLETPEVEPEPVAEAPVETSEPRRGFFARLFGFGRRREVPPAVAQEIEPAVHAEVADPGVVETSAEAEPDLEAAPADPPVEAEVPAPTAERSPELEEPLLEAEPGLEGEKLETDAEAGAGPDLAAELKASEDAAEAEVTAILTGVLDRLGAAHHRPFSRS